MGIVAAIARPIATPIAVTQVSPMTAPAAIGSGRYFVDREITRSCVLSPNSRRKIRRNAAANGAIPSIGVGMSTRDQSLCARNLDVRRSWADSPHELAEKAHVAGPAT